MNLADPFVDQSRLLPRRVEDSKASQEEDSRGLAHVRRDLEALFPRQGATDAEVNRVSGRHGSKLSACRELEPTRG